MDRRNCPALKIKWALCPGKATLPAAECGSSFPPVKPNATQRLLRSAAARMQTAAFGRRLHIAALVICALTLVALLCARLLALLPNAWFTPLTLGTVPALALVAAAVLMRKPVPAHVARTLDERAA